MKAISLWQPWASLIAWGEKRYETRSWSTPYRGPLAIHAGKDDKEGWEVCCVNSFYRDAMARGGKDYFKQLPFGAVLCVVNLIDVCPTDNVTRNALPGFRVSQK